MERSGRNSFPTPSLLHSMVDLRAVAFGLWKIDNSRWNASLRDLSLRLKSSSPRAGAGVKIGQLMVHCAFLARLVAEAAREAIRAHLHQVLEVRRRGPQGATFTPCEARIFLLRRNFPRADAFPWGSDKKARACGALVFSIVAIDLFRPLKRVARRFLAQSLPPHRGLRPSLVVCLSLT